MIVKNNMNLYPFVFALPIETRHRNVILDTSIECYCWFQYKTNILLLEYEN